LNRIHDWKELNQKHFFLNLSLQSILIPYTVLKRRDFPRWPVFRRIYSEVGAFDWPDCN
jgi:hypothetical protein